MMASLCVLIGQGPVGALPAHTGYIPAHWGKVEYGSWISKWLDLKDVALDVDFKAHSGQGALGDFFHNQPKEGPSFGKDFLAPSNSALHSDQMPLYQPSFGSCMRLSAQYARTQCYISLGRKDSFFSFLSGSFEPSYFSTGIGVRYQWSDEWAFELGTILHLPNQSPKNLEAMPIEPMSDFSEQVSTLSKPLKTSFAEGFFKIVCYFCHSK